jgi:DNA-directed RNA polymerase specialized sigma24 family protein
MLSQPEKAAIFHLLVNGSVREKNSAIQKIYEEFQCVMYKKLRYQYRDLSESEAQDIVQDSFLKLATTTSRPKSAESLTTWLITIVENTALDLFKKAYRKHEIPLPEEEDESQEVDRVQHRAQVHTPDFDVQECVSSSIVRFSEKFPQNAAVISMSLDKIAILKIAAIISRTEAATKQYIYESKKKLAPYIEHCLNT